MTGKAIALLGRLTADRAGVSGLEYGIAAALIGLAAVGAVAGLTGGLDSLFTAVAADLSCPPSSPTPCG